MNSPFVEIISMLFGLIKDIYSMLFEISLGPFSLGSMLFGLLLLAIVIQFMRKLFEVGDNSGSGSNSKK